MSLYFSGFKLIFKKIKFTIKPDKILLIYLTLSIMKFERNLKNKKSNNSIINSTFKNPTQIFIIHQFQSKSNQHNKVLRIIYTDAAQSYKLGETTNKN